MISKGRCYLGKLQTTAGTQEASLVATDFLEVLDDSELDYNFENEEDETVSGSIDDQNSIINGAISMTAKLDFNLRSFGPNTVPEYALPLQASGYTLTSTEIAAGVYRHNFVPGGNLDMTLWEYNGGSVIKAGNLKFDFTIEGTINKKGKISFAGKGQMGSLPILGATPTVTKNGSITPAIFPTSSRVIMGST